MTSVGADKFVIPAKAGIQVVDLLGLRLRGNDSKRIIQDIIYRDYLWQNHRNKGKAAGLRRLAGDYGQVISTTAPGFRLTLETEDRFGLWPFPVKEGLIYDVSFPRKRESRNPKVHAPKGTYLRKL